jgi:hypothetical protein
MSMMMGRNLKRYDSTSNLIHKSVSNLAAAGSHGGLSQIVEVKRRPPTILSLVGERALRLTGSDAC